MLTLLHGHIGQVRAQLEVQLANPQPLDVEGTSKFANRSTAPPEPSRYNRNVLQTTVLGCDMHIFVCVEPCTPFPPFDAA